VNLYQMGPRRFVIGECMRVEGTEAQAREQFEEVVEEIVTKGTKCISI